VRRYANPQQNIIMPGMQRQLEIYNYDEHKLDIWRKAIKNCKFECWDCNVCAHLQKSAQPAKLEFV